MAKRNRHKGFVATILLLALCFNLLTVGAFAADETSFVVKINNTELSFTTIIYVDGDKGNDTTGNGTEEKPYKTLNKGVGVSPQVGGAVILKGTDNSEVVITKGKKISIIGDYLNFKSSTTALFCSENINAYSPHDDDLKFYGIFFNNGRKSVWGETFSALKKIELNNCVFYEGTENSNVYVNSNTFNNCYVARTGTQFDKIVMNNTLHAKDGVIYDTSFYITSSSTVWKNAGTGLNPDGTKSHLGVYGGPFAWKSTGNYFTIENSMQADSKILNAIPEKNKIRVKENVSVNLVIQNIKEIAAEDIRIKYDSTKLQFLDCKELDGIKLVKSTTTDGEIRVILASKGIENVVNSDKILLKLNFKAIAKGEALVDITKGRVSDGISMEKDLDALACGETTIWIEEELFLDVNKNGIFTLLDLAIDARHLGEKVDSLPQYNTDIDINQAIDDNDLLKIGEYMISDPSYNF